MFLYSFFLILLSIIIGGCGILNQPANSIRSDTSTNVSGTDNSLPVVYQLHDVPHNPRKQKGTDCAPDSLRMMLTYRGRNVGEQDITRQLTSRGVGGGTTFAQMQEIAVNSYGFPTLMVPNCDLDSIKSAIVNKMPPIIAYRSGGRNFHAVVGVGYDDKRNQMFVHDPNILGVRKMRYSDLGGFSDDGSQRLSCLFVLPTGSTEDEFKEALSKFIPKDKVNKLVILSMYPSEIKK